PTFQHLNLPLGHGWDSTILSIIDEFKTLPNKEAQCMAEILHHYEEHLFCGEKMVRFYMLDESTCSAIFETVDKISVADSIFKENYPFTVAYTQLEELANTIELVKIDASD